MLYSDALYINQMSQKSYKKYLGTLKNGFTAKF